MWQPTRRIIAICILVLVTLLFIAPHQSRAANTGKVDKAIVFAVDVSGSLSRDELEMLRLGHAYALPNVVDTILAGEIGCIAVMYFEWSTIRNNILVDWMRVCSLADAETFRRALEAVQLTAGASSGNTPIGKALEFAGTQLLQTLPFETDEYIIDIAGDGSSNSGRPPSEVRDELTQANVTINGAVIKSRSTGGWRTHDGKVFPGSSNIHENPPGGIKYYYDQNVVNGFVIEANDYDEFPSIIERKFVLEMAYATR